PSARSCASASCRRVPPGVSAAGVLGCPGAGARRARNRHESGRHGRPQRHRHLMVVAAERMGDATMARKVVEMLVDDLDGTSIEDGSGGTVSFALDGTSYEIDLTAAHAAEFRELFADYVRVARIAGRP